MDPQNNSSMVYLGLCLVETALEVSADQLAKHPSILQLIKDPLCRNLLSVSLFKNIFHYLEKNHPFSVFDFSY